MFYAEHRPHIHHAIMFYVEHNSRPRTTLPHVLRRTHPRFAQRFNAMHRRWSLLLKCEKHYASLAQALHTISWDASSLLPIRRAAWARPRPPSTLLPRSRPLRSTHCWSIATRSQTPPAAWASSRTLTVSAPIIFLCRTPQPKRRCSPLSWSSCG